MATMPSASLVSTSNSTVNQTPNMNPGEVGVTGNESALTLALQTVEKKVRNLEKRKVKFCCEMAKCEKQRTNGAR